MKSSRQEIVVNLRSCVLSVGLSFSEAMREREMEMKTGEIKLRALTRLRLELQLFNFIYPRRSNRSRRDTENLQSCDSSFGKRSTKYSSTQEGAMP